MQLKSRLYECFCDMVNLVLSHNDSMTNDEAVITVCNLLGLDSNKLLACFPREVSFKETPVQQKGLLDNFLTQ